MSWRTLLPTIATALAALPPATAAADAPGTTALMSRPSGSGLVAGGQVNASYAGPRFATSADGCRTVFTSEADGLVTDDDNRFTNVFVRDTCRDETILASRATGAAGAAAQGHAGFATISADGNAVAFAVDAPNLGVDGYQLYVRRLDAKTTTLATPAAAGGGGADDWVGWPSLNGDGTMIAFASLAGNLVTGDTNGTRDVFVRTLNGTPQTRIVSRPHGSTTALGNGPSDRPSLDHRGHYVAFDSQATNLVNGDTNGKTDVFVRSLTYDYTTLVSRADGIAGALGNGASMYASMSGDGSKVAFSTSATNVFAGDANPQADVVVRTHDGDPVNELASRNLAGAQAPGDAVYPALDADGSHVAFSWDAVVDGTGGLARDRVWLRDLGADTTRLVSRGNGADGAIPAPGDWSDQASVDGDASKVTWSSDDDGLGSQGLYDGDFSQALQRDMPTETNALLARPTGSGTTPFTGNGDNASESTSQAISADGRYVAFASHANGLVADDDDRVMNVFRRDTKTGETILVSRGATAANGTSSDAAISADGTRIAFVSRATNLGGAEGHQVYVRDVAAGTTTLVSRAGGAGGAAGDARSWAPAISADGGRVAFASDAKNLGGSPASRSVYVRDLAAATTQLAGAGQEPALDADGSRVAFSTGAALVAADGSNDLDVYVRDLPSGQVTLASGEIEEQLSNGNAVQPSLDAAGDSVAFAATGYKHVGEHVYLQELTTPKPAPVLVSRAGGDSPMPQGSDSPSISADGRRVAFATWNEGGLVHLRDLDAGTTALLSRSSGDGATADGDSERPSMSANGRCVAFTAAARNLDGAYAGDFTQVWRRAVDGDCPAAEKPPVVDDGRHDEEDEAPGPLQQGPAPGGDRGPGGQAGPGGAAKPRIIIAPRTRLRRGAKGRLLALALECAPGARCTGTVRLALGRAKLGRALLALAGGKRGTVKVRLGAAGRRAVAKAGGRKVAVTITLAGGETRVAGVRIR